MKAIILVANQPESEKYHRLMRPLLCLHGFKSIDYAAHSMAEFADAASRALEEYDLIVNIAPPLLEEEMSIKQMYASGLGLPLEHNSKLEEELTAKFGATSGCAYNWAELCSFPKGAQIIKNPYAPNCGFIMLAPKQAIALLPHKTEEFADVLVDEFSLKLSKFSGKSASAKIVKTENWAQPQVDKILDRAKKEGLQTASLPLKEKELVLLAASSPELTARTQSEVLALFSANGAGQNLPQKSQPPLSEESGDDFATLAEKVAQQVDTADAQNTEKVAAKSEKPTQGAGAKAEAEETSPQKSQPPLSEDSADAFATFAEKVAQHVDVAGVPKAQSGQNTEKVAAESEKQTQGTGAKAETEETSPQKSQPPLSEDSADAFATLAEKVAQHVAETAAKKAESGQQNGNSAKKAKNKKLASWITAAVCLIFGITGMVYKDKLYQAQLQTVYGDLTLAEIYAAETALKERGETAALPNLNYREVLHSATYNLPPKLARFTALNPNVGAVLGFSEIDIPIWEAESPAESLGQNYIKVVEETGENFPKNTILYINRQTSEQVTLADYSQLYFYKEYPFLLLTDSYGETEYQIFAVVVYDPQSTKTDGFDIENYLGENADARENYLQSIAARTLICTGLNPNLQKDILTVVVDYDGFFDGSKLVLFAQQNENLQRQNADKATYNDNALLPSRWYAQQPDEERPQVFYEFDLTEKPKTEEVIPVKTQAEDKPEAPQAESPQEPSQLPAPPESSQPVPSSEASVPPSSSQQSSLAESSFEESSTEVSSEESSEESLEDEPNDDEEEEYIPPASLDERLSVKVNGQVRSMAVRELVAQAVESETRGNLHPEALKAHVVATYSYIKYNNNLGISPTVGLKSNVSTAVYNAVDQVLGQGVYYNGKICNAVYHSVSRGSTTSAQSVWGSNIPYLVSVSSEYDYMSPYFGGSYSISADNLATRIKNVYGIDAYAYSNDPADWISIDYSSMAPGDYVGAVEICGYTKSQGGSVKAGTAITGRGIREQLLSFALRSHSFEVSVNGSTITFTTEGYGHGVGMSQWGAHYLAQQEGYDYIDILTHYYQGTVVK